MEWVIDALNRANRYKNKELKQIRNKYLKESYRLKLCTTCERVWESETIGKIAYYKNFPTYGLKRITCRHCDGKTYTTYKDRSK